MLTNSLRNEMTCEWFGRGEMLSFSRQAREKINNCQTSGPPLRYEFTIYTHKGPVLLSFVVFNFDNLLD